MNFLVKTSLALFSLVLLLSCEKEKQQLIDPEFSNLVDSFFIKANHYDLNLNITDFDFSITLGELEGANGQCGRIGDKNQIIIDSTYWKFAIPENKYRIVFHELGHCILKRNHLNDSFSNGECKSIMKGGGTSNECTLNIFSEIWKNYYERELFTFDKLLPEWYDLNRTPQFRSTNNPNFIEIDTILGGDSIFLNNPLKENETFQISLKLNFSPEDSKAFFLNCDVLTARSNSEGQIEFWLKKSFNLNGFSGIANFTINRTQPIQEFSPLIIQIEKENNLYYFYVNGVITHVSDFIPWSENKIKVTILDQNVPLNLEVFSF